MKALLPGVSLVTVAAALAACSSSTASTPSADDRCSDGGSCAAAAGGGGSPPTSGIGAPTASIAGGGSTGRSDASAGAMDGGAASDAEATLPPAKLGIPSLGWGDYGVSASALDDLATAAGVPLKSIGMIEDFQTGWTTSTTLDWAPGDIAKWSQSAETGPSSGRNFVIGAFSLHSTDGSMDESTIVAGSNDSFFQQVVDNWASAGYTTRNGYSGQIFFRLNWEQNYPATTPGNYHSAQTTIAGWTEPSGAAYAQAMVPAWQHAVTIMRAEAAAKGVPLQIVWNPTGVNYGSDEYADPTRMYPGDDYVDVHCIDIYSNSLYPVNSPDGKSYTSWPGYWTEGKPFETGYTVGANVPLDTWWSSYDNIAHYFDFTDATVGDPDGKTAYGWGFAKATDYALVQGWYASALNPDGSPRKPKPLAICESGVIDYGPGPYTAKGAASDPNLLPYFKSRIATIQQRGGTFLFYILWNGPDSTGITSDMLATVGSTFGATW